MSSTEYVRNDNDDYVTERVTTDTQTAEVYGHLPYRVVTVTPSDGEVLNDGADVETVTVEIVDGLSVARETNPDAASTLAESGTVTLSIDGATIDVTISDGIGTKDVTTTKAAGSTIDVETVAYDSGPIEGDSAAIEVIQA